MVSILLITIGAALVAATLPVLLELTVVTAASVLPEPKRRRSGGSKGLRLATVIPAHDEEALIARTVESVRESIRCSGADALVVVVAHNCSDRTAERASEAGAEVVVFDDPSCRGKGNALVRGFDFAFSQKAEAVLVIDADSTISSNLFACVRQRLAEGANAVQCRYELSTADGSAKSGLSALAVRAFNFIRPAGRSRLGLSAGILGNGFALRKSVLMSTPYTAHSLVEDLEYHLHLVMAGTRVEFLEEATVSSSLPARRSGAAAQRSRWEGGRLLMARKWLAPLAAMSLRGHGRAIEPMLELAGLPLAYASAILVIGLAVPSAWIRIYAALGLVIVTTHVAAAARAGSNPGRDLRLLAMAPLYVLWKLRLLPRLIRNSMPGATWIRTDRSSAPLLPGETSPAHTE